MGVGNIVPVEQLLISARQPAKCPERQFEIPPKSLWANVAPTLRLVKALKESGIIKPTAATSAYRSVHSNDCSGGAKGSMHLTNNAIDINIDDSSAQTHALCEFWRKQGAAYRFGLGFYNPTAIHIDTSGHRTWGYDFTSKTSICNA